MKLACGWEKFRNERMPKNVSPAQLETHRDGFYTGAGCAFTAILDLRDCPAGSLEAEIYTVLLNDTLNELKAFVAEKTP